MRRIEAVTSSAPLVSSACSITDWLGYPAVPSKRRERKLRPAMTSRSSKTLLSSGKGFDDLDAVAGGDLGCLPARAGQDRFVECHRDAARARVEPLRLQDVDDTGGFGDARIGAVDADIDAHAGTVAALRLAAKRPGRKGAMAGSISDVRMKRLIASAVIGVRRMPLR